jgi:alanine-glyoxylate transaminase/serine-glyoxylate transaminase/serine-pyruvate transaminase
MFQTDNEWTLAITGTGNTGIETVLANLLEPRDLILLTVNGMWGTRVESMAIRIGNRSRAVSLKPWFKTLGFLKKQHWFKPVFLVFSSKLEPNT